MKLHGVIYQKTIFIDMAAINTNLTILLSIISRLKTKCMRTSLYWRTLRNLYFTVMKNSTYFILHSSEELYVICTSLHWRTPPTSYFTLLKSSMYFILHPAEEPYVIHTLRYWRTLRNSHFIVLKNSTYLKLHSTEEFYVIHTSL